MVRICEGLKSKEDMLNEAIEQYKALFVKARGDFDLLIQVRRSVLSRAYCPD